MNFTILSQVAKLNACLIFILLGVKNETNAYIHYVPWHKQQAAYFMYCRFMIVHMRGRFTMPTQCLSQYAYLITNVGKESCAVNSSMRITV